MTQNLTDFTISEPNAEIERLCAPVEAAEIADAVGKLTSQDFQYSVPPPTKLKVIADLITRLVRERDRDSSLIAREFKRAEAAEAETERLRKGGCARDQKTTQWCAEAVQALGRAEAAEAEVTRLAQLLAMFDPLLKMVPPRPYGISYELGREILDRLEAIARKMLEKES